MGKRNQEYPDIIAIFCASASSLGPVIVALQNLPSVEKKKRLKMYIIKRKKKMVTELNFSISSNEKNFKIASHLYKQHVF